MLHALRFAHLAVLFTTLVLRPDSARAQEVPDASSRVLVAAGVDGIVRDGDAFVVAPTVHVGYARLVGDGRVALRIAGDYWERRIPPSSVSAAGPLQAPESRSGRERVIGGTLLGTYPVRDRTSGPYAVGGLGVYRLSEQRVDADPSPPPPEVGGASPVSRTTAGAVSLGVGTVFRIGRAELFTEGRLIYFPQAWGRGQSGLRAGIVPLVVGARF